MVIHLVYVKQSTERHFEHVSRCLAAGKPVLVEKPLALTEQVLLAVVASLKWSVTTAMFAGDR